MKVQVKRKFATAQDTVAFELADPDAAPLPPFSAGAHIDVTLGNGLTRQYSLCNNPLDRSRYLIAVLLEPDSRGGSAAMHAIEEGAVLEISEPKNHFPLNPGAGHTLLLAGGIGITPILCMAERLSHIGGSFDLHYCVRTPERVAFRERLEQADMRDHVHLHIDSAPADQHLDLPAVTAEPAPDAHLYVCGPKGFIDAVLKSAKEAGWADDNLHREYFAGAVQAGDEREAGAFRVKLASSGQVIPVRVDQTIVSALADNGIDLPISCEQGVCGTCLTRVLDGEPDHRDFYLTDAERKANDQILPCCSRSKSAELVLDL